MKIMIFGAGAIGTIYGYVLSKAENEVVHYVRPNRAMQIKDGIQVSILDGRNEKNVKKIEDIYKISTITDFADIKEFDIIFVSIKHGSLEEAIKVLKKNEVKGEVIFFNGLWKDYSSMDNFISRGKYLWGYPVAGGNIDYDNRKLEGALLNNIILNEIDGKETERLSQIEKMFNESGINVEKPKNILHWIWVHMAINSGVISTCLKYRSASGFMNSTKALREGILTMRETLKVVEARGVNMNDFKNETRMFYFPAFLSSILFRVYFKKNVLSRKIMELHNNMDDLYEICNDVYKTATELGIDTPLFTQKEKYFLNNRGN